MDDTSRPTPIRRRFGRGYLPHFDYGGVFQMVTFRLADSLPASTTWVEGTTLANVDAELGRGLGRCWLQQPEVAPVVQGALEHFDGARYDLGPWVIMPNHVHVLVRPHSNQSLAAIVHSWKSFTAKRINEIVGSTGRVWQREYFDRMIRNRRHFEDASRYVRENPVLAGLVERAEEWPWSSVSGCTVVAVLGHADETSADRRQDAGAPSEERHDTSREGHDTSREGHDTSREGHDTSREGHDTSREGHDTSREGHDTSREGHDTPHR